MTHSETQMTRRFLRCIWSPTRTAMDAMTDSLLTLPIDQYNLALVSARRLKDAYMGQREWSVKRGTVTIEISHQYKQQ